MSIKERIKERTPSFPFGHQPTINVIILTHMLTSTTLYLVGSQPSTGVYIKKNFGYFLQSIKFIYIGFPTTSDSIDTYEVTIFINDTIQIKVKRPFLLYR